ncbi:dynamin family protein [uncultured Campylobacter sp.]|uniref:dynamin family protein n=1 Tax=uncultured Campylobacter sp. TaxID=218934 RepID=UPI0025D82F3B|nr:dynamin family protein [uncultured Campylobacter sp.]
MKCLEKLEKLEQIVARYNDRLSSISATLLENNQLKSSKALKEEIDSVQNTDRLMNIGIVGRVKAGKSSLLNAIVFDGASVLPKAATPMTAALTKLTYADKHQATVEFFSQEDIDDIKKEADEYEKMLKKELEECVNFFKKKDNLSESEIQEKALKKAKRSLETKKEAASADQYERMKKSSVDIKSLEKEAIVEFNSLNDLSKKLDRYVGSSGDLMPFTKSVTIGFPLESLKEVNIIDTPGVNDPVKSREARTLDELNKCDVIFIVSPAGQFMSSEDLGLMGRITQKAGIRELYVVASKFDTQLHGDVLEKSNKNLSKAFDMLISDLSSHMHTTLVDLKNNTRGVGNTFDSLIEQSSSRILHSSGISYTIKENIYNPENLDEGEQHAWNNLVENYPDNFSHKDKDLSIVSLDKLSNISKIKNILDEVAKRKNDILQEKIANLENTKTAAIDSYGAGLLGYITEQEKEINEGDLDELLSEKTKLEEIKSEASAILKSSFEGVCQDFSRNLSTLLKTKLNDLYKQATKESDAQTGSVTVAEQRTRDKGSGFLWFRDLAGTRYENYTEMVEYTTVNTNQVVSAINSFISDTEDEIKGIASKQIAEFKTSMPAQLIRALKDGLGEDKSSEIKAGKFRSIISTILTSLEIPVLCYRDKRLKNAAQGRLKGYDAENFINMAFNHIEDFRNSVKDDLSDFIDELDDSLGKFDLAKTLFDQYDKDIEKLTSDIKNKEMAIAELNRIKADIQGASL